MCLNHFHVSRDANISTHRVILRGLNAVTGFPQRVHADQTSFAFFVRIIIRAEIAVEIKAVRKREGKGPCMRDQKCREKERVKEKEISNSWRSLVSTTVRTSIIPLRYVDYTGKSFSSELRLWASFEMSEWIYTFLWKDGRRINGNHN